MEAITLAAAVGTLFTICTVASILLPDPEKPHVKQVVFAALATPAIWVFFTLFLALVITTLNEVVGFLP